MKGFRPKKDPVDPTPPMPRGRTAFEEKLIERDFLAVFKRISDTDWHDLKSPIEYAYRAGRISTPRRELETVGTVKYPSYMKIL